MLNSILKFVGLSAGKSLQSAADLKSVKHPKQGITLDRPENDRSVSHGVAGSARRQEVKAPVKKSSTVKKAVVKPKASPAKKAVTKAVAKSAAKPVAKPAAKSAAKPAVKKAVVKAPAKTAGKAVAQKPAKPVSKLGAKKPVAKPATQSVTKQPVKSAAKPVAKPPAKPQKAAAKPVKASAKPVSKPVLKPAPKKASVSAKSPSPSVKPSAKPVSKPVAKTTAKPVVKPAAKPAPAAKAPAAKPVAKAQAVKAAPAPVVAAAPAKPVVVPAPFKPKSSKFGLNSPANIAPKAMEVSTAAKTHFTMSSPVLAPPPQVAVKKDAKLVNNWKTKTAAQLSDQEAIAMPDAEYMKPLQLAFFRLKLVQLKKDILNSAGETTEHLREDTSVVPDPADRATIEEEHALELRTRDRERKLLKKIEQSISRIDADDYGYCDETGEAIGVARLIARPTASLSLEAQQRRELKQKMFGD
jgi:DnaK suppressor protein